MFSHSKNFHLLLWHTVIDFAILFQYNSGLYLFIFNLYAYTFVKKICNFCAKLLTFYIKIMTFKAKWITLSFFYLLKLSVQHMRYLLFGNLKESNHIKYLVTSGSSAVSIVLDAWLVLLNWLSSKSGKKILSSLT